MAYIMQETISLWGISSRINENSGNPKYTFDVVEMK